MSEYINLIGGLTPEELPKAPTNFVLETVSGATTTTFNLTWTNNMTLESHPPTAEGYYVVAVQKIVAGLPNWIIASTQNNLTLSAYTTTVGKLERAIRFRVAVLFRNSTTGAYTATYSTQVIIAYPNRIQPQAITDFAVDTTAYTNGWKFTEGIVGSTDTGGFTPRVIMTNPNIGNFSGNMRIYRIAPTTIQLMHQTSLQLDELDIDGGDAPKFKFSTTAGGVNYDLRVDSINEELVAKSQTYTITTPTGDNVPDLLAATDLEATDIQSREITISFVNNSGGNFVVQGLANNMPKGAPAYAGTSLRLQNLMPNTTYNILVRTTKAGVSINSTTISVQTLPA
jgi:hypothetical protein